jgi:pyrophosphatase PpaX
MQHYRPLPSDQPPQMVAPSMNSPVGTTRKRAAIFDLDGTLVNSMPLVVAMFSHAVEPYRPRPTVDEILSQLGGPPDTCIRRLLGPEAAESFSPAIARMLQYELDHAEDVVPFDGAMGLLESLRVSGTRLGNWTGRDRHSTISVLEAHRLAPFFGALVCGDDLPSHKPDPEGLLRSLDLLGVKTDQALFLGDSDVDVEGGHAADVCTILVNHGRTVPSLIASRAAEVYDDIKTAYAGVLRHFRGPE